MESTLSAFFDGIPESPAPEIRTVQKERLPSESNCRGQRRRGAPRRSLWQRGHRCLCNLSKRGIGHAPTYRIERDHGSKEFPQQLAVLRERWPLAFPTEHEDVRPLAMGVARQVAAAMGWSLPYTLGVLTRWKMAAVYCQAVLSNDQRIGLDGSLAEMVEAEAKELATKQMAQLEARKAAKKAAETARAAVVKPKPAQTRPTETPEQLRDRVRAGLLRRRA
jgi:hypothetical protein